MLRAEGLRKVYSLRSASGVGRSDLVAVDAFDLRLPAGGAVAVVGESGSGKTTCARMIVGLERPTAGTVTVGTETWAGGRSSVRDRRRRGAIVQMVFQDPYLSLDRRQSVRGCLDETLRLHHDLGGEEREARVAQLLEQVGLDPAHGDRLPKRLSGGQRQRVAIARALAPRPRALVLDESVAALDVSIQAQILNLLIGIRADTGIALLFISHDLTVVRKLCDEVLVMRHGRVVERGATAAVLSDPRDPYTRRLIDSAPRPGWRPRRRAEPGA